MMERIELPNKKKTERSEKRKLTSTLVYNVKQHKITLQGPIMLKQKIDLDATK